MENPIVSEAITDEIQRLAEIIKANPGCHMEVGKQDGNQWRLFKVEPDWSKDQADEYIDSITLAESYEFDFPGVSGLGVIDPVLYEAMAIALGITLAPEE